MAKQIGSTKLGSEEDGAKAAICRLWTTDCVSLWGTEC